MCSEVLEIRSPSQNEENKCSIIIDTRDRPDRFGHSSWGSFVFITLKFDRPF